MPHGNPGRSADSCQADRIAGRNSGHRSSHSHAFREYARQRPRRRPHQVRRADRDPPSWSPRWRSKSQIVAYIGLATIYGMLGKISESQSHAKQGLSELEKMRREPARQAIRESSVFPADGFEQLERMSHLHRTLTDQNSQGQNSLIRNCLSLNLPHDVQFLFPCREGEPWIARHPQCRSPPRSLCHGHQGDRPKCSLTVILRSDSPPAPPTDRRSRINAMNSISSPPEAAIIESRKR